MHVKLTPRLAAAAQLIPDCRVLADIGTDHGYLPGTLLLEGRIDRAIACDISLPSLDKARQLAAALGLADRMELRGGDGLRVLAPNEAECIVIAGMGGELITHILEASPAVAQSAALVLQPQTDAPMLRHWLFTHGYRIEAERAAVEGRRAYQALRTVYDGVVRSDGTPAEMELGAYNIQRGDAAVKALCAVKLRVYEEILGSLANAGTAAQERERMAALVAELRSVMNGD